MDGRVPVTGSQYAIEALNVSIVTPWQPWYRDLEVSNQCMNSSTSIMFYLDSDFQLVLKYFQIFQNYKLGAPYSQSFSPIKLDF